MSFFKKSKKWFKKTITKVKSQISTHKDRGGDSKYHLSYIHARNVYEEATRDIGGWPTNKDCDATLFAGLAYSASADVDILLARDTNLAWHRRPLMPHGPCNINGKDCGSKSTISNDMLIGVAQASVSLPKIAEDVLKYAKAHHMFMGSPKERVGEVLLKPYLLGLFKRIAGHKTKHPIIFTGSPVDYVQHLTAVGIHLYGRIHGKIEGHHLEALRSLRRRDRLNPTFEALIQRYTDRNYARAADLLAAGNVPSYIRGAENYRLVYELYTWAIITGQERPR